MSRTAQQQHDYYMANRERLRAQQSEYYLRNAEVIKERMRRNREAKPYDPETNRLRHLAWYRKKLTEDPTYFARKRAARRAQEVGEADYDYVWFRDFGLCHICGDGVDRKDAEFDHVIPLSRGGAHDNENIRVSHRFCNRSKGAR